jgi:hypothetical protein
MSADALDWIVRANMDSDLYQFSAEKHFDNAANPEALANRWEKGLHTYFTQALAAAAADNFKRKRSLQAFGKASHALADFYAHTDWIEMYAAHGEADKLAPFTGSAFPTHLLPPELSSGFFNLRYGLDGCPGKSGSYHPPHPYHHCHAVIAKDYPDKDHGAELAPDGRKYFEIAISSATRATRILWEEFQACLTDKYSPETYHKLAWDQ